MTYIFIDSNLYQQPIRSRNPDVKDLKLLLKFLKKRKPKKAKQKDTLLVSDQVVDEYYRYEDECTLSTRKKIEEEESEIKKVREVILKTPPENLTKSQKTLLKVVQKKEAEFLKGRPARLKQYDEKVTVAKDVVGDLFSIAKKMECDDKIFRLAEMRAKRGMHPKPNKSAIEYEDVSIGDAINWELLLGEPDGEDYVLITKDGDFTKKDGSLHKTLSDEWSRKRPKNEIKVFRSVYEYLDSVGYVEKPVKAPKRKTTKISTESMATVEDSAANGKSLSTLFNGPNIPATAQPPNNTMFKSLAYTVRLPSTYSFIDNLAPRNNPLSEAQINSILTLLESFGADSVTVRGVENALRGKQ